MRSFLVRSFIFQVLSINALAKSITLEFVSQPLNYSVLNHTSPDLQAIDKNNRGVECGHIVKVKDVYHLFVTELLSPSCATGEYWCHTMIAHWISHVDDVSQWHRIGTVAAGNGGCTNQNQSVSHDNAYWSPFVDYIHSENYWFLTYVGYNVPCNSYVDRGNIYLTRYDVPGNNILSNNFSNAHQIIMDSNGSQSWWEGTKDTVDSFSNVYYVNIKDAQKYDINSTMFAFYGSCCDFNAPTPDAKWGVGLVYSTSDTMYGPWIRYKHNPINFTGGVENPMVTKTSAGYYLVMFCAVLQQINGCGFSWSVDGIQWTQTQIIPTGNMPSCRIPLALMEQDDNQTFTFLYTDFDERQQGVYVWEGYEGLYISNLKLTVDD